MLLLVGQNKKPPLFRGGFFYYNAMQVNQKIIFSLSPLPAQHRFRRLWQERQ